MNKLTKLFRDLFILSIGLVTVTSVLIFIFLSLPIYIYRWIVCKVVAPFFRPKLGKAVTSLGVAFGIDFASKGVYSKASRCNVVVSLFSDSTIPLEHVMRDFNERLIKKTVNEDSQELCYPEFQQYVETWMGFLFWKQDQQFDLKNHIKLHKIVETCTREKADQLVEDLLNKPHIPKRSPWEVHVIHGHHHGDLKYKQGDRGNGGSGGGSEKMTLIILRTHHVLNDGFSLFKTIIELINGPLSVVKDARVAVESNPTIFRKALTCLQLPVRLFYDIGSFGAINYKPQMNTPWHVRDSNKKWKNLHQKSQLFPLEKIVFIKNKLGVSFTSVLYACMSAALSKDLECRTEKGSRAFKEKVKYLPVSVILPVPGPRDKLRNHFTGSIMDLPIKSNLSPKERLLHCEEKYIDAKKKIIPYAIPYVFKALGSHLAIVPSLCMYNKWLSAGLSSMPGPRTLLEYRGQSLFSIGIAFSNFCGDAGIGFQMFTYAGFLQITVTVENGLMDKAELTKLLCHACDEINILYELAEKADTNKSVAVEMLDE